LFVDDPDIFNANNGILYIRDRAVVITRSGDVYPVAIETNVIGENQEFTDLTISFAPGMEQMTTNGQPVYSVIQYEYWDFDPYFTLKKFMSSGFGDPQYDEISAMLQEKGLSNTLVASTGTDGNYIYDTSSVPVYDLHPVKRNAMGQILYQVYDKWANDGEGDYLRDGYGEIREFTESQIWQYTIITSNRYQCSVIYESLPGLTIVRPVETGGFTVTYSEPLSFDIPVDNNGRGIISQEKRILLEAEGEFAAGTILYQDGGGNIIARFTEEGEFYQYEEGTFVDPDSGENQDIYTAYRGEGRDDTLDLIAYFSAGSQTMLHEVMTGLYMAVPDESKTTTFGRGLQTMNSFYGEADFFAFDKEGNLVMLVKEILEALYQSTGPEDEAFDGAVVMIIKDPGGIPLIRILELTDGRIAFLFDDNTWIDSLCNTGYIPVPVNRTLEGFDGASQLQLNSLAAPNSQIRFAGANTTLTDDGDEDNINIMSDNVVIIAEDSGNIYTAANPLKIAPNISDTVNLRLIKTNAGGAYDASAYVVAARAGDNVNLHDTEIDFGGWLDLTVAAGNTAMNNVDILEGGTINLTAGSGSIDMNDVNVAGSLNMETGKGDITMDDVDVSGTLNMETGGGDITMNDVDISGSMTAGTDAGDVNLNDVDVTSTGSLGITDGQGDVIVDQVSSDGTLQITANDGSLLMKDEDSILNIGKNSTAAAGQTWVDIGGDIGAENMTFKINIELDQDGKAQPFNIKNVVNIYLQQETGIKTSDDTLPTEGREEDGTVRDHDEAANGMEDEDETVNVTMPAQTPQEIAAQLNSGNLTREQLLTLISGKLSGQEIKTLLGIDEAAIDALVAALNNMDAAELAELVTSLGLSAAEPEKKLDLSSLNSSDPAKLAELAIDLGLPEEASKEDILAALRSKLGLAANANVSMIINAYNTYYAGVLSQYRTEVMDSYRASIDALLDTDSSLNEGQIAYLLSLGFSEEQGAVTALLAGALTALQPVVTGFDGEGNPIYEQAVDEFGDPLFIEATDENGNPVLDEYGDPVLIPVYVMESRIEDNTLFAAYWDSLTDVQKQELIAAAWELAAYPEPQENELQHRVLILNIGKSTGRSNIDNQGDIIITQAEGIFTAEEVISHYGDVAVSSEDIAGVENKTNVYGEDINLTATTGSITGLNVEEKSWPLTTIAHITDEDKQNEAYGETGSKTWIMVRDPVTGEIIMLFAIDYTAVRDLDLDTATSITAKAAGDIEIKEITGDMGVNVIEAGGKVTLDAPGSIYDVRGEDETRENIKAGSGADLTAGGTLGTNQNYIDTDINGTVKAVTGGDININDSGSLVLIADSESGQVNVKTAASLDLSNTTGDLVIGLIAAGDSAVVTSVGGITPGDKLGADAHIKAKNISLAALNGAVGTPENPLDIDTDAGAGGKLAASADGGGININEISGDLIIGLITANNDGTVNIVADGAILVGTINSTGGGGVTLTAEDGDITETGGTDAIKAAAEAEMAAAQARSAANLAAAQVVILQNYVTNILPELLGRPAAQQALDEAGADLAAAQQQLADIKAQIMTLQGDLVTLGDEKIILEQNLTEAQNELDQAIADGEPSTVINQLTTARNNAQAAVNAKQGEIDGKNNQIAGLQGQETQLENTTIPRLTQARDAAQDILDEIDAEIAQAQIDLVDARAAARDSLETTALELEGIAAAKRSAAHHSGISTEGDLNLHLSNGGTIGAADNALGVNVGGVLTAAAGEGAELKGLYLESGADLNLAPVTVKGAVQIDSWGDIQGAADSSGAIITADNAVLRSLDGDIGRQAVPLLVNLDRVTASGNNVYIKNLKSLIIDTIIGGLVDIAADGDIIAGTPEGGGNENNIIADELNLNASGNIGSADGRLVTDTAGLSASAGNLYLKNNSGNMTVRRIITSGAADIKTAGNIRDTGSETGQSTSITARNLKIDAFGSIGETGNPLDVMVPGANTVNTSSGYGTVNLTNWYKGGGGGEGGGGGGGGGGPTPQPAEITLTDPVTGVVVTGTGIDKKAKLVVTTGTAHSSGVCPVCAYIGELIRTGKVLVNYDISLTSPFTDKVTVSIPVAREYEGKMLTIVFCGEDKLQIMNKVVTDGMITFTTDRLTAYAVLDDKYVFVPYGEYTAVDGVKWPLDASRFQDVEPTAWYFGAVAYVHALKIMAGVSDELFDPYGSTTRAMLAAILYRLEGSPAVVGGSSFTDVEPGAWYTNGVIWAEQKGIIAGYGDGTYGVDDPITREQMAAILYRFAQYKGYDVSVGEETNILSYNDAFDISEYAIPAMQWACGAGIIQGSYGSLMPLSDATRAEIAAIIQRFQEIYTRTLLVDEKLL